jgi:hypothetical protein
MHQAISNHVVAVEVLLDIYGDSPEQLRELMKDELRELVERAGVGDV